MTYEIMIQSNQKEPLYSPEMAAEIAEVDIQYVYRCEHFGIIESSLAAGNIRRYSLADIRHIALTARLQNELELDIDAIGVIIHLRSQVVDLMKQVEGMEKKFFENEQQMRAEIIRLRRMLASMINKLCIT